MLKPYVTAKFNRGVKNRRLPAFVETIRISQQGYAVLTYSCISFLLFKPIGIKGFRDFAGFYRFDFSPEKHHIKRIFRLIPATGVQKFNDYDV